jgi:alpha-1,2-glucosyltransferase
MAFPAKRFELKGRDDYLLYAAISLVIGMVMLFFNRPILEDEVAHLPQIEKFFNGDFSMVQDLTTIPGYHAFMALIAKLLGTTSLAVMRLVNVVISVVCIGVYALLLREVHGKTPPHRLIQFSFFPIIFPYYFLVYTDVASLLLVLCAFLLALKNRHIWAAAVGIASVLVRQNNVVWLVMIPLLAHVMHNDFQWKRHHLSALLKSGWMYGVGVAAFAAFVVWNNGVAVGDQASHPAFTFHLGNVYFFLALYGLFFLPSIVANFPRMLASIREERFGVLIFAALFGLYLLAYKTDHIYNNFAPDFFLRNYVLMAITASPLLKVLAFIPMALAALDMLANSIRRRELAVVYLFILLVLLPSWLVEQRYYIVPFALLLLFRRDDGPLVEPLTSLYYVAVSMIFVYGIQNNYFFL